MSFHLYHINEIYSNADGTVQFIELHGESDGQNLMTTHKIKVVQGGTTHEFTFPNNLPSGQTLNKSVLLATQGFADLGIVTPDYIIPDGFLFTDGGTVTFPSDSLTNDILTYASLPTDGTQSLNGSGGTNLTNSPTNFAGASGAIVPATNVIDGTSGNDNLVGTAGNDTLNGLDGFDNLQGLGGADVLNGGDNVDTADYNASPSAVTVNLLAGTGSGGDAQGDTFISVESLIGSAFGDVLTGNDGINQLRGGDGNDTLQGGGGDDDLFGGVGTDSLVGGAGTDYAYYDASPSGVTINLQAGTGSGGDAQGDTLSGIENISGSHFDDILTGNDGANTISGAPGGPYGNDTFFGLGGDDQLVAGDGNDILDGGLGADSMQGYTGDDTYYVDNAGDQILDDFNQGIDSVFSTISYTLPDYVESLTLQGTGAINATGNSLDNALTGNANANVLNGGAGDDTLNGGAGVDTAVYAGIYRMHLLTGSPAGTASLESLAEGADALASIEKLVFVDGSMNYDALASVWRVDRLYEATLDRHGDPVGLNFWGVQLDLGVPLSTVAIGFTDSVEFQSIYGALNNSAFVEQLYLNVLDRPSDPAGLASWVGFLDSGTFTRGQVVVGFSESQEFIDAHASQIAAGHWDIDETAGSVARLYYGTLDRAPDSQGLTNWVNFLKAGTYTLPQAAEGFTGSVEFQAVYGALDNSAFVNQLYLNVLDRPADPGGLANWLGFLNTGTTRGQVALGFTESQEFQIQMIGQIDGGIATIDGIFEPPPDPG